MNNNKTLFTIPLVNIWYIIVTLIFIIMRCLNIIDWSPLWILCPLWLPFAISILIIIVIYLLRVLLFMIDSIYKLFTK